VLQRGAYGQPKEAPFFVLPLIFKSQKIYIKRDIKSIPSFSLATMGQPSSSFSLTGTPLDISLGVCIDYGTSDSIDVVDNSISFLEGVSLDIFRWIEGTPIEVHPYYFYSAALSHQPPILFLSRGTRLYYRSPNLLSVTIGCLGGLAK
jgi:hypothetical protein